MPKPLDLDIVSTSNSAWRLLLGGTEVFVHVKNAMGKLEADTRTEAVASALRQSLIS